MKKITDLNSLSEIDKSLIYKAIEIRHYAYAPYSGYKVGAALTDASGNIHTGCNIESAVLTLTSHAEMVAIDSMVKSGSLSFNRIAIALRGMGESPATPCGLCRQKMSEFDKSCSSTIFIANMDDNDQLINIYETTLKELLPYPFGGDNIG